MGTRLGADAAESLLRGTGRAGPAPLRAGSDSLAGPCWPRGSGRVSSAGQRYRSDGCVTTAPDGTAAARARAGLPGVPLLPPEPVQNWQCCRREGGRDFWL